MCSPQLLHLDKGGSPLWFNGWITRTKFTHEGQMPRMNSFKAFTSESRVDGKPTVWTLHEDNMLCLQSNRVHQFIHEEDKTLDLIVNAARDVVAIA